MITRPMKSTAVGIFGPGKKCHPLPGMQEFIRAAHVENAQIDQSMLSALLPGH